MSCSSPPNLQIVCQQHLFPLQAAFVELLLAAKIVALQWVAVRNNDSVPAEKDFEFGRPDPLVSQDSTAAAAAEKTVVFGCVALEVEAEQAQHYYLLHHKALLVAGDSSVVDFPAVVGLPVVAEHTAAGLAYFDLPTDLKLMDKLAAVLVVEET